MKAALIRSANDAAVAIAEKITGSVEACVRMMNDKARALGMDNTYYGTVDGLPPTPGHDVDYTTPLDLATLARTIIRSTGLLQWSSMEEAPFDGGVAMLHNTNRLIGHLEGCDGIKTGFTLNAGFNLTATVKRGDMRLVSVVLGAPSNRERFVQSAHLLSWGFNNFDRIELLRRGEPLPVQVQVQSGGTIQPVSENDIAVVLPKGRIPEVRLKFDIPPSISGPVAYGDTIGHVIVLDGGDVVLVEVGWTRSVFSRTGGRTRFPAYASAAGRCILAYMPEAQRAQVLSHSPLAPRTRETYEHSLAAWIAPHLGEVPVGKLTPELVRTWHSQASASGHETAVRQAYALLRAVLNAAVDDGDLAVIAIVWRPVGSSDERVGRVVLEDFGPGLPQLIDRDTAFEQAGE